MIRKFLSVLRKEIVDNLRDRRTLLTVLLFGPLFGPVLYTSMMNVIINQQIGNADQPLKLAVVGAQYAPNLVDYLKQHNTLIEPAPADPRRAVSNGQQDVVLVIHKIFRSELRSGSPAELQLVQDASRQSAAKNVRRAQKLLEGYAQEISSLRLLVHGVMPNNIMVPFAIENVDVSTPQSRAAIILSFVPYFFLFAGIIGAFYLAIDATAGERERGSLEPLLTTSVSRGTLVSAKLVAITGFSAVSLGLDILAMAGCQSLIPAQELNVVINFGPQFAISAFLVGVPFCLFIAALLTVVASFTRSYKEAQTWLSFIFVVPMIPVFGLMMFPAQPRLWMMLVPTMSQDVLMISLLKGEALNPWFVTASVGSTLLLGLALAWLATWLYRREKILG